jgi:hypothetical protein
MENEGNMGDDGKLAEVEVFAATGTQQYTMLSVLADCKTSMEP